MELNEYQKKARKTARYPGKRDGLPDKAINYCLIGLGGEAGEVLNIWKKYLRGSKDFEEAKIWLLDEFGDCLWYLSMAAHELGISLEEIAEWNLIKLAKRYIEKGPAPLPSNTNP